MPQWRRWRKHNRSWAQSVEGRAQQWRPVEPSLPASRRRGLPACFPSDRSDRPISGCPRWLPRFPPRWRPRWSKAAPPAWSLHISRRREPQWTRFLPAVGSLPYGGIPVFPAALQEFSLPFVRGSAALLQQVWLAPGQEPGKPPKASSPRNRGQRGMRNLPDRPFHHWQVRAGLSLPRWRRCRRPGIAGRRTAGLAGWGECTWRRCHSSRQESSRR